MPGSRGPGQLEWGSPGSPSSPQLPSAAGGLYMRSEAWPRAVHTGDQAQPALQVELGQGKQLGGGYNRTGRDGDGRLVHPLSREEGPYRLGRDSELCRGTSLEERRLNVTSDPFPQPKPPFFPLPATPAQGEQPYHCPLGSQPSAWSDSFSGDGGALGPHPSVITSSAGPNSRLPPTSCVS